MIRKLFEEAEKRLKKDQVGITNYAHTRGFKLYYAVVEPRQLASGEFTWLMKLTNTENKQNHPMEIPGVKIPIREAPKLQVLPPIPALTIATKRKT